MVNTMNLEQFLNIRSVPEMRSNLPERILMASRTVSLQRVKVKSSVLRAWLSDIVGGIALPQPAMVFSFILMIGLLVGSSMDLSGIFGEEDVSSYFMVSDSVSYEAAVYGEWL